MGWLGCAVGGEAWCVLSWRYKKTEVHGSKRQLSVKVWIGVGVPVVARRGMTPSEHTKARRRVMAKQGSYRCIDGR